MEPFSKEWFDEASTMWRENKRVCKYGYFRYTCEFTFSPCGYYIRNGSRTAVYYTQQAKRGHKCGRDVYKDNNLCRQHWALTKNLPTSTAIDISQ